MNRSRLLWLSAWGAAFLALLTPLLFGALHPDYQQMRDYISELGAVDAPHAWWVAWFGFLPIGLLTAITAILLPGALPKGRLAVVAPLLMLGVGVSLGYVGAIIWPCDPGCPTVGSATQQIHNLLGLLEYGLGGLGLFLFARLFWPLPEWRSLALIMAGLGVVVWFALGMMGDPQQAEWRGGWQRLAEISLFGGMLWIVRQAGQQSRTT